MTVQLPRIPECKRCRKMVKENGGYLHNPITDRFDLYCLDCYNALTIGKDIV